ncbi:MAG: hypothetical protein ACP5D7_21165 [Limnospira sp.]
MSELISICRIVWEGQKVKRKAIALFQQYRCDIIFLVSLLIAGIKLVLNIDRVSDLRMFDETMYLASGLHLLADGLPDPQWGPIYSLWYFILSIFTSDPVNLHFLNQQVLPVAIVIALYLCLRTLTVSPAISLATSGLFLMSAILDIDPRPTHFALLILLITLIVATPTRTAIAYFSRLGIGVLLMSYVRPEYALSVVLIWAIVIHEMICSFKIEVNRKRNFSEIVLFLLSTILLLISIGNPLSGGRSWFAFSQHFSLNWAAWHDLRLDPWDHHVDWIPILFEGADNLAEAFWNSPFLLIRHILANFNRYLNQSIALLFVSFQSFGWSAVFVDKLIFAEIVLLALVCRHIVQKRDRILQYLDRNRWRRLAVTAAVLLLAIFPSAILIYPRSHYLVIQSALLLIILAVLFDATIAESARQNFKLDRAIAAGSILVLLTPNLALGWCTAYDWCGIPRNLGAVELPHQNTVNFIRNLNIEKPVQLLDANGGFATYFGDNYTWILPWDKSRDRDIDEFLKNNKADAILVTPTLTGHPNFRGDRQFQNLLKNPQSRGFVEHPIPQTQFRFLLKQTE